MNPLQQALKEWKVAIEALESGQTALVVRKGGIREKSFAVPEKRFLLYPSYEHQNKGQLKPAYHGLLDSLPQRPDTGPVHFTSFAEVHGAYEISEPESLKAIDHHHVWTPEYAEQRLRWRPKKPLTVLVLRSYLLPQKVVLPYSENYGGCKSWIPLEQPVSTEGAAPALSDEEFERLIAPAVEELKSHQVAPVGS